MFDPTRFDFLFVLVQDGRRWFIPSGEIEGRHCIRVGGDKYSEFQIGQTEPLDYAEGGRSKLDPARGGAGVGEPGRPVKSVPSFAEWVRFPPPPLSPPAGGELVSGGEHPAIGRTRMSSNHQVTVPLAVAGASSIEPGDRFRVESQGIGRFVMTRVEEYIESHLDQLSLAESEDE
jgi:hypothetical protein